MQRIRVKGLQHLPLLLHLPSYCRTFCCPKQTTVSSLDNTVAWALCVFFMNERSLESSFSEFVGLLGMSKQEKRPRREYLLSSSG